MRDVPASLFLEKNGIAYSLDKLGFLERPFSFKNKYGFSLNITINDQPIFFGRRRKRVTGVEEIFDYIYRFCIGKINNLGKTEKHWFSPEGCYIEQNLES